VRLLLTDRLTCPRCGPTFGLILLADRLVDRRVRDGVLGCPNCRDSFPIVDGFADLRAPPRGEIGPGLADSPGGGNGGTEDEASRWVALLGIHRGPGTVALVGSPARNAASLAGAVEDLEVVAVDPDLRSWPDTGGVSRVVSAPGLPFFSQTLRGVVVDGRLAGGILAEAARVVSAMSRVVVVRAPDDTGAILEKAGLSILASESETVVAARG
jgi:uncharacterized protein YbaR (Trm112 family)